MAIKQPFVRVDAEVRPGHDELQNERAARRRGTRSKMAARGPKNRGENAANRKFLIGTWLSLSFMLIYAATIGLSLLAPGYSLLDRIASGFLLFGLGFIIVHGFGYANSMIKANWAYKSSKPPIFAALGGPRVACLIASFNEPSDVLEETVAAVMALDYQGKEVFILDDSTTVEARESAQEIAARYGIVCVQRTNRRGYKAGAINDFLPFVTAPYLALFDADALPTAQFLRECVPQIDENPKLGFLQTPQFYANTQVSYAALASARQQNVFYEYICEGKSVSRAAFCCGTNVIFRRSALVDCGGFNEESVTEDFATSFHMHVKGYDSLYLNRIYVYSLAPENLAAYFTQQSRWSFGTMGTARQFIRQFFKNPRVLSAGQWWEYFLSATYYLVGWVNFFFILLPMLYLFFDIRPLRQDVFTYLLVFVPYMLFTLNMFYSGMERRGYSLGETILGQQIGFLSFPIHMKSAFSVLMGHKRPFGVTPKGVGGRISWWALWPQISLMLFSLGAFLAGVSRIVMGRDSDVTAVGLNSLWALYHVWMLSGIFRLNQPVREGAGKWFFDDARAGRTSSLLPNLQGVKNPLTLGRLGMVFTLLAVSVLGFAGFQIAGWNGAPPVPVNVYLVDRTLGRDARQHRGVTWTLNYLKVKKQPGFGASASASKNGRTHYDVDLDYFGMVPDSKAVAKKDPTGQGDLVAYGFDRPLPARLSNPGAVYLADTYGEYEEFNARLGKYVRTRDARRGLSSVEIDSIETFARRGGLVMAEWNTLGYPTRPGNFIPPAQLEIAIENQRQRIARLSRKTIPAARETLRRAQSGGTFKAVGIARGRLEDARGALIDATYKLRGLQGVTVSNAINARQGAAAARLEKLLRVSYSGWYGRYVENFAREREYDFRLWKSVRDSLTKRNGGRITEPSGAGFVFYPDGPSRIFNPNTGTFQSRASSQPVAILENELGAHLTGDLALITKNEAPGIADDPLLRGVAAQVPGRNWFDVVAPQSGARVLANYQLSLAPAAAARLKAVGFPAGAIAKNGRSLIFPAAIAGRDGNVSGGQLRSLYLAGDASTNFSLSPLAQKFPALGGIEAILTPRFGDFPARTYWGFYEPILRNVFDDTKRIRVNR
ncbi:glycosyltransferase [Abditibacterium utsteinense]|uniref:glycosyltransferase n=1 Tax=Abditibacterium utsteinense TaxID=1960156 RepID=UPI000F46D8F5|nr:glycosyltransferase [Abditibacterium utsteinense]